MSFNPTFEERRALAAKAKEAALAKLRAKPPVDEAVLAERRAAQQARDEAKLKASAEKREAREREKAEKARKAAEAAQAAAAAKKPELTEAERKAARDARYAARKSRTGKR